jgi:ClpP class serine protease
MEKNHPRILEALTTEPWLCTEEGVRQMIAIASYEGDIGALQTKLESRLPDSFNATRRDNVAIISLSGPIFPKANLMTEISGATALSQFALDFQTAEEDPDVTDILVNFSTPGGVVDGINEAANLVFNSTKHTVGYVGSLSASAGYWICAACDEIVVDATARLGSIGVVAGIPPKSEDDPLEFTNTASPNKRVDMDTKAGQASLVAELDALADVFISSVATFRNVTDKKVRADFGKGGMLIGQAAVDAGMADRLGSYEALIQELTNTKRGGTNMDLAALTKEDLLASRSDLVTAISTDATTALSATHSAELTESSNQVSALTEENTTLKAENETLKEEKTVNGDRVAALERIDAIREEKALNAQASGIVSEKLTASTIPVRLHSKVKAGISNDAFVAEGVLDTVAFGASVDTEIKDWQESIGTPSAVLGIGAINQGEEDPEASADDDIVARMVGK